MPDTSPAPKPRILLLSAYDADSHRRWREQLVASQPRFDWHTLTLPPRFFRWRIRGNALSWLNEPLLKEPWDLVLATSMVDLAALRGLHPHLAATPAVLYMHENQFAYPKSEGQHASIDPQMVNLYSAIAATTVVFNSDWNRQSFLDGVERLLRTLPDAVPAGVLARLADKSVVVPVPIEDRLFDERAVPIDRKCRWFDSSLKIVWAARWEYDKGPVHLLACLRELEARGVEFSLCLLGEKFRNSPPEFGKIEREFSHRIVQLGFVNSREEYLDWLRSGEVVLSTALHEFQGLSMLEAVASGCVPLAPNRLSYPELFPVEFLYDSFPENPEKEAEAAIDRLMSLLPDVLGRSTTPGPDVSRFSSSSLRREYEEILTKLAAPGAQRQS